ncbi:probable serine/threonine-protein kinase DDB_G0278665 [Culex pipiens pallens]|uniref:probable serine/threonine-protein kinase DDB_G0278665 n=1 Tax=Culex pipiens pallens TaxID=42434 RepID=UPI0022AA9266|nr:probable serine/threonine-protein kinase DDB_G0278665 [Culex pipiens pallens]
MSCVENKKLLGQKADLSERLKSAQTTAPQSYAGVVNEGTSTTVLQTQTAPPQTNPIDCISIAGTDTATILPNHSTDVTNELSGIGTGDEHQIENSRNEESNDEEIGYVYFLLSFSLIGIVVLGLFGAYRCLRVATVLGRGTGTQTSEALATLPIQFITSDDLAAAVAAAAAGASINADSNHLPVPMLSVQSPGCAGMERLGVPARSSIGSPPLRDERNRRLRVDSGTSGAASANSNSSTIYQHHPNVHSHHSHHSAVGNSSNSTSSNFMSIHNHHAQFHQATTTTSRTTAQKDTGSSGGSSSNSYLKAASTGSSSTSSSFYGTINNNSNNLCSASTISRCPHHVALPDGERGPDRDLQIRSSSQQSEIPRTYVKAPPNKTVRDVPVQHQQHHHHPSSSVGGIGSSVSSSASSSMNNLTSQHARFGGSGSGISLGNRALVNSMSTIGSSQAAAAAAKSDKQKKTILWFLAGNKTSKTSASATATTATSSSSGISVNSSSHNNNNIGPNSSSGAASCNNNTISYQTRSNPTASSALAAASMSGSRSGLSSSSHLAVSGIHSHNHHYRQSTASTVQQRHQPTSSIPSSASGSSTNSSSSTSTPMSVSASPSPDTSTHYM